jgi:hypothetical protein
VVYYLYDELAVVAEGVEGFDDAAAPMVRDSVNPGNAVVDFEGAVGFRMHSDLVKREGP